MRSTDFRNITPLVMLRQDGYDPYTPVDLGMPMKALMKYNLKPDKVSVPSLGNAFSQGTDTFACGVHEGMMGASNIVIERLSGLLTLCDSDSTPLVMGTVSKMRICSVGHTGMISRVVMAKLFRESQVKYRLVTK